MASFKTIKSPGRGKWQEARIAQMLQMQSKFGGPIAAPTLNGEAALRVLAYWWRQRGRFWQGWHQALAKLQRSGLSASPATLTNIFNQEQNEIVRDAVIEAVADLERLAPRSAPQNFTDEQTKLDAATMFRRFLVGDLKSKIPPLKPENARVVLPAVTVKAPKKIVIPNPTPKLPGKKKPPDAELDIDPDKIPRPRLPKLPKGPGLGWVLFLGFVLWSGKDDE